MAGNGLSAAFHWAMLVVLARLGSVEIVGRYTLALAVTGPVVLFCEMQLRALLAASTDARELLRPYLGFRSATALAQMGLIAGLVLLIGMPAETAAVVLVMGLCKSVEGLSDLVFGVFQNREQLHRIAVSQAVRSGLYVVAMGAVLGAGGSLLQGVLAVTGVALSTLLILDAPSALRRIGSEGGFGTSGSSGNRPEARRLLTLGLPLGLSSLLISGIAVIPRFFMERFHGVAALGYFAAMAQVTMIGKTVADAMGQSALPRLARDWREDRKRFLRLLATLAGAAAGLGLIGILVSAFAGPLLLAALYRPDYAGRNDVFVLLMTAAGIAYVGSTLTVGLTAAGALKVQLPLAALVMAGELAACGMMVPRMGARGAAWALLLSSGVWLLGAGLGVLRAFRVGTLPSSAARP